MSIVLGPDHIWDMKDVINIVRSKKKWTEESILLLIFYISIFTCYNEIHYSLRPEIHAILAQRYVLVY
jgi:hypothetical protein